MTYAQILAGGVSFQLYNKTTNAVVPTSVSDGGGYIEITEDATSDHNTIYKIDQFVGAVSEITLYTEGDSAKTYALLGASQNEDVVAIRLFETETIISGESTYFVYAEINGKMYIPYIKSEDAEFRIRTSGTEIVSTDVFELTNMETVFPKTKVTILENGGIVQFDEFNNTRVQSTERVYVVYEEDFSTNDPWKYGQDGFFATEYGIMLRVNGIWHMLAWNGSSCSVESPGINLYGGGSNIYKETNPQLIADVVSSTPLAEAKQNLTESFGITFGEDIIVADNRDGEGIEPFYPMI